MEEVSKDNPTVSDFNTEGNVVPQVKRVRKTKKENVMPEEMTTEVSAKETTVATIEEKAPTPNEAKEVSGLSKESNEKSLQRRNNNRGQQKNNFKATSQNKFQPNNNTTACPANLQRYRWWMGQLYQ